MTTENFSQQILEMRNCIDELRRENAVAHQLTQKNFVSLQELVASNHAELKQYFIGVDPDRHIKDHHQMELERSEESDRRSIKNAIISGIITTIILGIGGWIIVNAIDSYGNKQRVEIIEQIKRELQPKTTP